MRNGVETIIFGSEVLMELSKFLEPSVFYKSVIFQVDVCSNLEPKLKKSATNSLYGAYPIA